MDQWSKPCDQSAYCRYVPWTRRDRRNSMSARLCDSINFRGSLWNADAPTRAVSCRILARRRCRPFLLHIGFCSRPRAVCPRRHEKLPRRSRAFFYPKGIPPLARDDILSLVTILLSAIFAGQGTFASVWGNIEEATAALFQVVNLKMVLCAHYHVAECVTGSPIRIYWSLSLEEQFYLIFPTLLFFMGARRTALLALLLVLLQLFLYRPWPSPGWFFRTDAIALGVCIAYTHHRGWAEKISFGLLDNNIIRPIVATSLCLMIFLVAKADLLPFYNGLVVLVAGILVFIASLDRGYLFRNPTVLRFLSYVGERSYSIYLVHMLSLVLLRTHDIAGSRASRPNQSYLAGDCHCAGYASGGILLSIYRGPPTASWCQDCRAKERCRSVAGSHLGKRAPRHLPLERA